MLLEFLETNPGIASGILNRPDANVNTGHLWETITVSLNASGPPVYTSDGWKRVSKWFFNILYAILNLYLY